MAAGIERDFGAEAAATSPAAAIARIRQTRLRLGDWLGQSEWHWLDQRSISATSRLKINIWKGSMNALLLWVLAFARLPPSNRAAAQQVITPENHQATATAKQERKQGAPDILATITRSRSTNSRGYEVVIRNDGSATAEIGGSSFALRTEPSRSQQFPPGTIDTKTLRRLLTEISDVSRIPIGPCAKSVSFGTRTQISYGGKTSGDLQCVRQQALGGDQALLQASEDLGRFVQTTLSQLKINDKRVSSNQ